MCRTNANINTDYANKVVLTRDGSKQGIASGSTRRCQLAGCGGLNIMVRWPDGKITWPCSAGLREIVNVTYQIK